MVLQLAAEEQPGVDGVSVLPEILFPPPAPDADPGFLRRDQVRDEVIAIPMVRHIQAHIKASLHLMETSYQED